MNDNTVLIQVRNLKKSYISGSTEISVLNGIDLNIQAAEMVAVMGPSGVGKSTLLHILGALDRPGSGEVLYEDKDIFSLKSDGLAGFRNKTIGFVFQFHHLLPEFTALENTIMPALIAGQTMEEAKKKGMQLLEQVGLSKRIAHRPGELSGGEQQRVAIARALILGPRVVIADEPTGNLDTHTGNEIFKLLQDLNKNGITFLMATHNEDMASKCGKIIRMLDGKIL
ncbi:MAG TPA: ABC transporter ATP-binding protein [Thermodesulfovibrionia bacterium]|nr:ABC transporter ATP-binding protein [Thermodesulfovibrionia bacterium]